MPETSTLPLEDLLNYLSDDVLGLDGTSPLASVAFHVVEEKTGTVVTRKLVIDVKLGSTASGVVEAFSKVVKIDKDFESNILDITAQIRTWVGSVSGDLADAALQNLSPDNRLFGVMLNGLVDDVARNQLLNDLSSSFETAVLNLNLPELSQIKSAFGTAFDSIRDNLYVNAPKTLIHFYTANGIAALIDALRGGSNGNSYATAISKIGDGFLLGEMDKLVTSLLTDHTYSFDSAGFGKALEDAVFDGFLLDDIRDHFFDDFLGLDGKSTFETALESVLTDQTRTVFENAVGEIFDFVSNDFSGFDFGDLLSGINVISIANQLIGAVTPQDLANIFVNIDSIGEAAASQLGSVLANAILGDTFASLAIEGATALFGDAAASALATTIFQGLGTLFTGGLGMIAGSLVYEALDWVTGGWLSHLIGSLFGSDSPQVWYNVSFNGGNLLPHLDASKDSDASQRKAIGDIAQAYADMTSDIIDFIGVRIASYTGPYNLPISWRMKSFGKNVWIGPEDHPIFMSPHPEEVARAAVTYTLQHITFDHGTMRGKAFDIWKHDMGDGAMALSTSEAFLVLEQYMGRADFAQAYVDNPTIIDAVLVGPPSIAQAAFMTDYLWALEHGLFDGVHFKALPQPETGPLAHSAAMEVAEDGRLSALLDADGANLSYAVAQNGGPTHGTVAITPSGGLIYTPNADYFGQDSVTFTVTDGSGHTSTATVTITVVSDGRNAIAGTAQSESLTGTDRVDEISGYAGDDLIDGGKGADFMAGGPGNDRYFVDDAGDTVTERPGEGIDTVVASVSYTLSQDVENLTLVGTDPLTATGNASANIIIGNAGANLIDGGAGPDTMRGGAGDDLYRVDNTGDLVIELASEGIDSVESSVSFTLGANVENLTLTGASAINGVGNGLANNLTGNSAANELTGGAGNDRLNGMAGADIMRGGPGNDTYVVDRTADQTIEAPGEGIDTVESAISWTLSDNIENLTLTGTAGIKGTGNDLANTLIGNTAGNRLDGLGGTDIMRGGQGNDTYVVDNVKDVVVELADEGVDTVEASVSYTLTPNVERLILTGAANIDGVGNALANQLTGNSGNNRLNGGAGADTMRGGAGDDTFVIDDPGDYALELAGEGIDTVETSLSLMLADNIENLILTGRGNTNATGNMLANQLTGNAGNNRLNGQGGADTMIGGQGNDVYVFDNSGDKAIELDGEGIDTVESSVTVVALGNFIENLTLTGIAAINGAGNGLDNVIIGNSGANRLDGGAGNDRIDGGAGADTMLGGAGDDVFVVDNTGDTVIENEGQGTDTVESRVSFTLGANVEILRLTGEGSINGTGNSAGNILYGNSGNNRLDGKAGADRMEGGAGDDIYQVDNVGDVVVEGVNAGNDTVESTVSFVLGANIEQLRLLGSANINGAGNSAANVLYGNSGNNRIDGGGGIDTMRGGLGNDTYVIDNAKDQAIELDGEGVDTIETSLSFTLGAFFENLTLTGVAAVNGTGNDLDNHLIGNDGINKLSSGGGNDRLDGMGGDDRLDGGAGADIMSGGIGNDYYFVDDAGDQVVERAGEGIDTVETLISLTLAANVENLVLGGVAGIDGTGNSLANRLTGNFGANRLDGGLGADIMAGGKGNDTYVVDNIGDVVQEAANEGVDTVESKIDWTLGDNIENLTLTGTGATKGVGNALANVIHGNAGNNRLDGGAGNDQIYGGGGHDTLIGGAGRDNFFFDGPIGANESDTILDYNVADDTIQLDRHIFTGIATNGALAASAFRLGTAAADADDRIIYDPATGRIFYDPDGDGLAAAIEIAVVTAGLALTYADFVGYS